MNIKTLLEELGDLIKDSELITNYCMDNFAKHHIVIIGGDPKDDLKADKMPYFIVFAGTTDRNLDQVTYNISIGVSIVDNTINTDEDYLEDYEGFTHLMVLKEAVETELYKKYGRIVFKSSSIINEVFPIHSAEVSATLTVPISKRSCREPL